MEQELKPFMKSTNTPVVGQPVTITLYVSAEDLYNVVPQPSLDQQDELDAYCILGDNNDISRGKPEPGGNLNTFTSQIYYNKQVNWFGDNILDNGYQVNIDSITNAGSLFPSETLNGNGGRVVGTPNKTSGGDTYTLNFSIVAPGQGPPEDRTKKYHLDPKLGGNP